MNFLLQTVKMNEKQKSAVFAVALLLLAALFYLVFFSPQHQRMLNLQNQYQTERQKVKSIEAFALVHPNIDQYLTELDGQFAQVEKQLPESLAIGDFLIQAEQVSQDSGVQLMHIKPLPVINKNGYREIPLEVVIKGKFSQTIAFLKKLEEISRFNAVTNMSVQSKQGILESKLTVILYSYGSTPAAGSPAAPAKK
ncbi:MAG: type 4a pilus biogenesis protein PilO [Veillonellales bacterium]